MTSPPTRMKSVTAGEATGEHPAGLPGWLGTARGDRSVEEPGRPCLVEAKATNARREDITVVAVGQGDGEACSSEEAG